MKAYLKEREATETARRVCWLHNGDLVFRDEDGFNYQVDRKEDIIIRSGFNIASLEMENSPLRTFGRPGSRSGIHSSRNGR